MTWVCQKQSGPVSILPPHVGVLINWQNPPKLSTSIDALQISNEYALLTTEC